MLYCSIVSIPRLGIEDVKWHLVQDLRIPQNHYSIFGSRQSNIQTPGIIQETNSLMFIAPDTTQDDVILLSALEGVNACDLNIFVKILLQRSVELHVVDNVRSLPFVRCNNSDLAWYNSRFEEFGDDLLNVGSLRSRK